MVINSLGGNCPVQGDGTVDGVPFYFRARGEHWSMSIGPDPVSICCGMIDGWHREQPWGDGPFAAGWMERDVAREIITRCAMEYSSEVAGT